MQGQVAVATQGDQVLLRIIPAFTAKFLAMKDVLQAPARLTSPSIPLHDFSKMLGPPKRTASALAARGESLDSSTKKIFIIHSHRS
jgi:hypothetical protein